MSIFVLTCISMLFEPFRPIEESIRILQERQVWFTAAAQNIATLASPFLGQSTTSEGQTTGREDPEVAPSDQEGGPLTVVFVRSELNGLLLLGQGGSGLSGCSLSTTEGRDGRENAEG